MSRETPAFEKKMRKWKAPYAVLRSEAPAFEKIETTVGGIEARIAGFWKKIETAVRGIETRSAGF